MKILDLSMKNNILSYQEFLENETYYGEKVRGHALSTDQKLKKYLTTSGLRKKLIEDGDYYFIAQCVWDFGLERFYS